VSAAGFRLRHILCFGKLIFASVHEARAVRADVLENVIDARGAEGTLVGADACLKQIRRPPLLQFSQVGLSQACGLRLAVLRNKL
jgi:hypothetical protein